MKLIMIFLFIILISSCVFAPIRAPHSHTYISLNNDKKKLKVYCVSNLKTLYFYENSGLTFRVKSKVFIDKREGFKKLEYKNIFDKKSYQTSEKITDNKFHQLFTVDSLSLFTTETNSEEYYYPEIDINLN